MGDKNADDLASFIIYTRHALAKYGFDIGEYSYGQPMIRWWGEAARLKIGKFCSIADGVTIYLGGEHRTDWITTYPFSALTQIWPEATGIVGHPATKGDVVIGNDVWLGTQSVILSGITIGDGAVVGARAVVTHDVPPYGIVAGNPARLIRKRFSDEVIGKLLALRWWDWDITRIRANIKHLCSGNVDALLLIAHEQGLKGRQASCEWEMTRMSTVVEAFNLALQHHQAGRLQEAEAICQQVLQSHPNYPDALHLFGMIAYQVGRYDVAVDYISQAIKSQPARADFYNNLGEAYQRLGQRDEALSNYRQALALSPGLLSAITNIGGILKQQGKLDEAAAHYRQMLGLHPESVDLYNNLGNVLQEQGNLEEALAQYKQAVALRPDCAEVHNNMGGAFYDLGKLEEAEACYKEALRLKPEYAEAHWNNGRAQLLAGNFEEGWKEYSWRWWTELFRPWTRQFSRPAWDGREDISGRTLLLHTEQGHGDAIQFVRYVPLVAKRATVIVECQPELKRLFETVEGITRVVARGEPLPDFDLHLPLLSLPGVLGTTVETIPANVPYVYANPELVRAWRAKLAWDGRSLKVGLTWAGGRSDPKRDCALALLAPLATRRGVTFYSLQKRDAAMQGTRPPEGMALIDRTAEVSDFADTAALISHLDLVISVDTSVAHLAGAMGKPVWTLLRFAADWRWLLTREDSPWYPTMRLFRQERPGDWAIVIERVRQALTRLNHP